MTSFNNTYDLDLLRREIIASNSESLPLTADKPIQDFFNHPDRDKFIDELRKKWNVNHDKFFKFLPPAGEKEFELWLSSLLQSLADARTASAEWISLSTMQESLWLQVNEAKNLYQSISGEELPSKLFSQVQLDHQLFQIDTLIKSSEQHSARIDTLIDTRRQEHEKTKAAQQALSWTQYNRDTSNPPSENFIKGTNEYMKDFDSKKRVLQGAINASAYLSELSWNETNHRDQDELDVNNDRIVALKDAKTALNKAVTDLESQRVSMEFRRKIISERLDKLEKRLYGSSLNITNRINGVIEKYLYATSSIQYHAKGFVNSLQNIFQTAAPKLLIDNLIEAATFDASDRGAQLDNIDIILKNFQDWFAYIQANTYRTTLIRTFNARLDNTKKYRGTVTFPVPTDHYIGEIARVRSIRIIAPFILAAIPCKIIVNAPKTGKQKINNVAVPIKQEGHQDIQEFTSLLLPTNQSDGFWGSKKFWNVCPYGGAWSIELQPLFPLKAPDEIDFLFEVTVDLVNHSDAL